MAMGRPVNSMSTSPRLALQVFWRKGYEGASMADLTETMGSPTQPLFRVRNKEELFARRWIDMSTDPAVTYRLRSESRSHAPLLNICFMAPRTPSPIRIIRRDALRCRGRYPAAMPPNPSNGN